MLYFFMLSCLILASRVERGIPSLAAAPFGPATFPLLSAKSLFDHFLLVTLERSLSEDPTPDWTAASLESHARST